MKKKSLTLIMLVLGVGGFAHAAEVAAVPHIEDWRWYNSDFRQPLSAVHWTMIDWPSLAILERDQTVKEILYDGPVQYSTPCLRREPGSPQRCIVLQVQKGDQKKIVSEPSEIYQMMSPLNSDKKAVAYIALTTPCFRLRDKVMDGWVTYAGGDHFILLYQSEPMSACKDPILGVLFRVASDGVVRKIASELRSYSH